MTATPDTGALDTQGPASDGQPPSGPVGRAPAEALALAVGVFLIYCVGACRTIYVGDSGELVAAAATLGIPHPSGYPLYVLLGHLWIQLLPLGSVAFEMSLFSGFFGALACGLLHLVGRRLGLSFLASAVGALALAFSPSFWSQATVQRVYTLGAFFVVAVLACALEWHRTRRVHWMVLAAFLAGLGACNHTVMGVVGVAVGLFAVLTDLGWSKRPHHLAACVGAGLLGLLPYAYLPWRSRQDPRLDWGDPETFASFKDVVLRKDFWHRAWIESPGDFLIILGDYVRGLGEEFAWVGLVLALAAVIVGWRRWPVALPLFVMAANLWAVGLHGSRSDIFIWHRYYIPSYVMMAVLVGWGAQLAWERWGKHAVAVLLIPLALLITGYAKFDRSDFTLADDFSRTLLSTLPPGAHLAASDDNILFVLIYLHLVEGLRPDVHLIMQGVGDAELPTLRFDPDDDPLFFTHHPNWNFPGLEVVPMGLVFRTVRSGSPPPEPNIPKDALDGAWDPGIPKDYLAKNLTGHFHYMLGLTFENRDWPRAQTEFEKAMQLADTNDVLFYNLGLIYRRNGLLRRSLEAFERSAEINPRHIPSNNPVRPIDKVGEARQAVEALEALEASIAPGLTAPEGTAAWHRDMASAMAARGEALLGRGHGLLAEELDEGRAGTD